MDAPFFQTSFKDFTISPRNWHAFAMILQTLFYELELEFMRQCPLWGLFADNEKSVFHFLETIFWGCITVEVPMRCAERIWDLTDFITRTHVYPEAYGGFSNVWRCQLKCEQSPPEMVAVKAIRPLTSDEEYQVKERDVEREFNIWAELEHENIIPLYGITHGFGQFPAFVCPWADNGTLTEYLDKFETQLDMKDRMALLADIAAGLRYLHSRNVVHGDLSGANVLITKSGRACLADFGLSTLVKQVSNTAEILLPGNIRWAAPELFEGPPEGIPVSSQLSTREADIYSFGSIMLQTLSGRLPFHWVHRDAQVVILISRGERLSREPGWDGKDIPDVLWDFMRTCWADRSKRPTSEEIVTFIRDQMSRL